MIPFNKSPYTWNEDSYVLDSIKSRKVAWDWCFSIQCQRWFEENLPCKKGLLTPSCTHALEMSAILIGISPGDEVIMPSYTFVSTANAFVLRGAKIIFVDIRPDTMNIDEALIEEAITSKTKAIVVVHYAGVGCEMEKIMVIAERRGIFVIEDAAQWMMARYNWLQLGTIGHLGAYSFHETKNYTSWGEWGLLIVNAPEFMERSEVIREKWTNRSQFFRGMVDKYTWVDIGSSYLMSDIQAAYLWWQIESSESILLDRLKSWNHYFESLLDLEKRGFIELPKIPENCTNNGHMFYLKVQDINTRTLFIEHMKRIWIMTVFHYVPLHSSPAGKKYGAFHWKDIYTTSESERLVRLPMYLGLSFEERVLIIDSIRDFFLEKKA